jgi:hypothetical protein
MGTGGWREGLDKWRMVVMVVVIMMVVVVVVVIVAMATSDSKWLQY